TALGTLQAFSLITSEKGGAVLEMHRLVQLSTQKWLELQGSITKWQEEALRLLSEKFPQGNYEDWVTCEALSPHVQVVVGYVFRSNSCQLQRASILNNVSWYDKELGRYVAAYEK